MHDAIPCVLKQKDFTEKSEGGEGGGTGWEKWGHFSTHLMLKDILICGSNVQNYCLLQDFLAAGVATKTCVGIKVSTSTTLAYMHFAFLVLSSAEWLFKNEVELHDW